jgi:hypothetical protein
VAGAAARELLCAVLAAEARSLRSRAAAAERELFAAHPARRLQVSEWESGRDTSARVPLLLPACQLGDAFCAACLA